MQKPVADSRQPDMTGQPPVRIAVLRAFAKGTEGRIVGDVAASLRRPDTNVRMLDSEGAFFSRAHFASINWSDALVVHTPLAYAILYVLWAKLQGKPVISLIWDSYPVTLDGRRYDKSIRRRLIDRIENAVISLSAHLLVPSRDFLAVPRLTRALVIGLWPRLCFKPSHGRSYLEGREEACPKQADQTVRILFAGQVNATRGLPQAVAALKVRFGDAFNLIIASPNPLPHVLEHDPAVTHVGYLDRQGLNTEMARCDAGLVALAEEFDGPGLPSKTFDYLAAGLPCIYFGKRLDHYADALVDSGAGIVMAAEADKLSKSCLRVMQSRMGIAAPAFSANFELDPETFSNLILKLVRKSY